MKPLITILIIMANLTASIAFAGPGTVGNGDDGRDLEAAVPVDGGPLLEARAQAAALLQKLDTAGIAGLGILLPEVQTTPFYRVKSDTASEEQGAFHTNMNGMVYARTFAQPHAATRFFPASGNLDRSQLIALQIHEALHRALPASVREDESIVASITLAITGPGANHDQIAATVRRLVPEQDRITVNAAAPVPVSETTEYPIPEDARVHQPSTVGYGYRTFRDPNSKMLYPVSAMHSLRSDLYPFGSSRDPIGIGIEASLLQTNTGTLSGPLVVSGRARLWSARGFDVGLWAVASLNSLSAEELKNSPFGRDVGTLGISMRKDLAVLYFENFLSVSLPGTSVQKIGAVDYTYSYGSVLNVSAHAGANLWKLKFGGFADVNLADYFRVSGGAFDPFDSGRYRIVSGGPELTFGTKDFALAVQGRFLLGATRGANFDYLGNIMGPGLAQGSLGGSLSVFF